MLDVWSHSFQGQLNRLTVYNLACRIACGIPMRDAGGGKDDLFPANQQVFANDSFAEFVFDDLQSGSVQSQRLPFVKADEALQFRNGC